MKFRHLLIFLCCLQFVLAQTKENIQTITLLYPEGQLKETGTIINGRKDGAWIEYEVTGKLKKYRSYKNGVPNGWYADFDVYGNLLKEGNIESEKYTGISYEYEKGRILTKKVWVKSLSIVPDSASLSFYKELTYDLNSGHVRSEGYWRNKLKDSLWTYFDDQGNLRARERYVLGKRDGMQEKFYPSGKIAERTHCKLGNYNGERLVLTESGDTTEFGNYKNGKRDGFFILQEPLRIKDLNQDEEPYRIQGNYTLGKLNGKVLISYLSGKKAAEENYLLDRLNGKRILYFSNGNKMLEGEYDNGNMVGLERVYYPNGKIQRESMYNAGKLHGRQMYYFENSIQSELIDFDNGNIVQLKRFYESGFLREIINYKGGKKNSREFFEDKKRK